MAILRRERRRMLRLCTVAGLVLILSACAGAQAGPQEAAPPDPDAITLMVESQFRAGVQVSTLFMPSRSQRRLGVVRADGRGQYSFPWRSGTLFLVVEDRASGTEIASNPLALDEQHRGATILLTVDPGMRVIARFLPPGSRR